MTLKSSDVVMLKSGGPHMTVTGVSALTIEIDRIYVVWFDKEDSVSSYTFNSDLLVKVESE